MKRETILAKIRDTHRSVDRGGSSERFSTKRICAEPRARNNIHRRRRKPGRGIFTTNSPAVRSFRRLTFRRKFFSLRDRNPAERPRYDNYYRSTFTTTARTVHCFATRTYGQIEIFHSDHVRRARTRPDTRVDKIRIFVHYTSLPRMHQTT